MTPRFDGFPPETLAFLRGLEKHNNREWFQARKQQFEEKVKQPMAELVEAINHKLLGFAPAHVTEPRAAIYRIYRDTRFSKDKSPYKTHVAAVFPRRGLAKHAGGAFYFHVSPKEVAVAAGVYMPGPDELRAIRNHLTEHHRELERLLRGRRLRSVAGELQGEQLVRPPKGFSRDHPSEALIRCKQWYFYSSIDPELAETPQLIRELVNYFRTTAPIVDFLNAPLGRKRRDPLINQGLAGPLPGFRVKR